MKQKYILSLFLVITLSGFSTLVGQEKRAIVIKKTQHGDSLKAEIKVKHDVQIIGDEGEEHFIWVETDEAKAEADSLMQKVFIHKAPWHERKAARIIIKESGFFKKNKIIIDFDPITRVIKKVIDNEEEVPPQKYHKYQDYLEDATEYTELEALSPVMEEFDLKLELGALPNMQVLEGLDSLIIKLEELESKHAVLKKERYKSMKHIIKLDHLAEGVQDIMADAGMTPPQKIEDISIKSGKFYVNGAELKGEVGEKCIQLYTQHSDLSLEDLNKKGEEIDIHIRF